VPSPETSHKLIPEDLVGEEVKVDLEEEEEDKVAGDVEAKEVIVAGYVTQTHFKGFREIMTTFYWFSHMGK
jgi:hypothetical protein